MNPIFMPFDLTQMTHLLEENSALYDSYIERVFESESITDLISASHWYSDALVCLWQQPQVVMHSAA